VIVPFAGEHSGAGELTWGQLDIWTCMQRQGSSLAFGGTFPLPAGTTVADVAADLEYLMSRHDSLRTRLRIRPGGQVQQVVTAAGEIALAVIDPGDADPGEVAAAAYPRFEAQQFDYERDWPIRWAVVARDGIATHLISAMCHLAADGMGALALMDDLRRRAAGETGPVTALRPLELAVRQRAPAGRRANAAALAFWERTLRAIPPRRFAGSDDWREPRYWQAYYYSPASLLAAEAVAARTGTGTSTVLLAAYAVMLTRLTGIDPAVIVVVVDNRFRRELADVVSPMCGPTPCVIDVAGADFDEVVRRAWRTSLHAYKLAYYNPLDREEVERRVAAERGEAVDTGCFFNDRRMASREERARGPAPSAAGLRAALRRSELVEGFRRDQPNDRCFLSIDNVPDTICYELAVDTHYVSPADLEACLRGLESVIVEAAL
jgi:hypothetical protein